MIRDDMARKNAMSLSGSCRAFLLTDRRSHISTVDFLDFLPSFGFGNVEVRGRFLPVC